jgi:hypothetical protein
LRILPSNPFSTVSSSPDPAVFAEPWSEPLLQAEPAFEPDDEPAVESGPDPEVLATLARLERFLGAIQSLRA